MSGDSPVADVDPLESAPTGPRWVIFLIFLFFIFPIAGLAICWKDAGGRVSRGAEIYLDAQLPYILGPDRKAALEREGTLWFLDEVNWDEVAAWDKEVGPFKSVRSVVVTRPMSAGEAPDHQIWQFTDFKVVAEHERGELTYEINVGQKTKDRGWKINKIRAVP